MISQCLFPIIIFLAAWLVIWLYADAKRRGYPGLFVAALGVFLGPIALLIWLLVRPNRK